VRELWFGEVGSQGSVPSRAETFLLTVQLESGAYSTSYVMGVRGKVAEYEADHSPLFSTNVDDVSSYISVFVYFIVLT
jgi:hypothetical protein